MIAPDERRLGMDRTITRRDFLNGVAIGAAGLVSSPWLAGLDAAAAQFAQDAAGYYPPALTGMRGSHDGSYEVAHAARDPRFWRTAGQPVQTGERYDLIVVGGGISGLAAAYFYRAQVGANARILILDNHDDFGGHAKRNEFRPNGTLWIANGGTAGISSPFPFSTEALGLMSAIGIEPVALSAEASRAGDRSVFQGLQGAYFFDKETFGVDRLVLGSPARGNREFLEETIQAPVVHFAYPFGNPDACGPREACIARSAGFRSAVTTRRIASGSQRPGASRTLTWIGPR